MRIIGVFRCAFWGIAIFFQTIVFGFLFIVTTLFDLLARLFYIVFRIVPFVVPVVVLIQHAIKNVGMYYRPIGNPINFFQMMIDYFKGLDSDGKWFVFIIVLLGVVLKVVMAIILNKISGVAISSDIFRQNMKVKMDDTMRKLKKAAAVVFYGSERKFIEDVKKDYMNSSNYMLRV